MKTHNTHGGMHPGKRARVKLRDGTVRVLKFKNTVGGTMYFKDEDGNDVEIRNKQIASFSIYKEKGATLE